VNGGAGFPRRSFCVPASSADARANENSHSDCQEAGRAPARRVPGSNTRTKTMFAVIKTGGLQYRVAANDVVTVGKLAGEPGDLIELGEVLMLGGDAVVVGAPVVEGATVAGEVVRHARGPKVIAFKKRRRKNSKRKRGHRQDYTVVRITEILTDGRKPDLAAHAEAKRLEAVAAQPG
jgi:large subunit ribosomal protein L21